MKEINIIKNALDLIKENYTPDEVVEALQLKIQNLEATCRELDGQYHSTYKDWQDSLEEIEQLEARTPGKHNLEQDEYRVMWTIELTADSARNAAIKALEMHRDPDSIAVAFDVASNNTNYHVDLLENDDEK